jgi:hypothetical protein
MLTRHYLPPGRALLHQIGDRVEEGDALSDGVLNPADVVRHRGVGEGRQHFVRAMGDAFRENGLSINRRNLEVLARGVIRHVTIEDPDGVGDHLVDDTVNYDAIEKSHVPPPDAAALHPRKAVGQYLHRSALHYTIGTRVTPRVAKELEELGEGEVLASPTKPGFRPEMVRLMEAGGGHDWMTQLGESYVKKHLVESALSGKAESDLHGVSPLPGLAWGVEFGQPPKGKTGY